MTIKDKEKLCRYLNITKLDKGKNEYISFKKLIKTFINLFKTNNHNINSLNYEILIFRIFLTILVAPAFNRYSIK